MIRRFVVGACIAGLVVLSGCATNMTSVSAFGKMTTALGGQTKTILQGYQGVCQERLELQNEKQRVFSKLAKYWQSDNNKSADVAAMQGLVDSEAALAKSTCEKTNSIVASAMTQIPPVFVAYGENLEKLAGDSFVSYNPELNTLIETLNKLGDVDHGLSADQVTAIENISKLLYEAAVRNYRQRELDKVLSADMRNNFAAVVNALDKVASVYGEVLAERTKEDFDTFQGHLDFGLTHKLLPDPMAVAAFSTRAELALERDKLRKQAVDDYRATLAAFLIAYDKAQDSLANPPTKDLAKEIFNFAKAAVKAQRQLDKAF